MILSREPCVTTGFTGSRGPGAAAIEFMILRGAMRLLLRNNAALPTSEVARNKQARPSPAAAMSVLGPRQRRRRRQTDYSGSEILKYHTLSGLDRADVHGS